MSEFEDPDIARLVTALNGLDTRRLHNWGTRLAGILAGGGRLLVAGNGGSAAQAQHFTAELTGRFHASRRPLSALALHVDTSTVTAVGNDFGFDEVFARQVCAHGRPGDVLVGLSTSGRSRNVVRAMVAAHELGMETWAMTGQAPSDLSRACDEYVAVDADSASTIQECHLVAIHRVCAVVDAIVGAAEEPNHFAAVGLSDPAPTGTTPKRAARPLVIVGDVLLDVDLVGEVERVSPEAPVVVVTRARRHSRPGGAGLAAILAAGEGHTVTLVTAIPEDHAGREVAQVLRQAGVSVVNLGTSGQMAVKTRIRARGQTVLMLDESPAPTPVGRLPASGEATLRDCAAVVVADYGRGVAASADIREVIADIAGRTPVVWDPHPLGPPPVAGVTVAVPNAREVRGAAGAAHPPGLMGDVACARIAREGWKVGHVVVTRGESGAVVIADDTALPVVAPAKSTPGADSWGAGDRFAVALAGELAGGAVVSTAVHRAVVAASEYVSKTASIPACAADRQVTAGDAQAVVDRVRAAGGTVVATGGCFDLLHRGHVELLEQARRLGDCLVVCLNSDTSVARLKGSPRPIVPAHDRHEVLLALACVDAVVVFDEDTPAEVLTRLRPDVWVKGGDYAVAELPERLVVESAGGHVVLVPYLDGRSSTALIERAGSRPQETPCR